jgi:hypothetical protein
MAFYHVSGAGSILLLRAVPWREASSVVEIEEERDAAGGQGSNFIFILPVAQ